MIVQLRLAAIYRKLGREADAMELEDEIRALLARADPDYWLLRRLQAGRDFAANR